MSIPGLDLDQLRAYAATKIPDLSGLALSDPELTAEMITGGRSNLTYRLHSAAGVFILRRQPLGHVLASAHDMKREFRVISALANTSLSPSPIPVPKALHYCEDPAVLGSPFYLMESVDGTIFRSSGQLADVGPKNVAAIAFSLIDCLADLHDVDPTKVGLGDFGRPAGYNERQLRRWSGQLDASVSRELAGMPELREALAKNIPNPPTGGIVHGDFRLDNVIFRPEQPFDRPQIAAILDWEMSTLGDPLADLALTLLYTGRPIPAGGGGELDPPPIDVPGHPSLRELIERYADRTGRDLRELRWYRAFAAFKLAVILEGIHYRFQHGQTVGEGFATMGELVPGLIDDGLHTIAQSD